MIRQSVRQVTLLQQITDLRIHKFLGALIFFAGIYLLRYPSAILNAMATGWVSSQYTYVSTTSIMQPAYTRYVCKTSNCACANAPWNVSDSSDPPLCRALNNLEDTAETDGSTPEKAGTCFIQEQCSGGMFRRVTNATSCEYHCTIQRQLVYFVFYEYNDMSYAIPNSIVCRGITPDEVKQCVRNAREVSRSFNGVERWVHSSQPTVLYDTIPHGWQHRVINVCHFITAIGLGCIGSYILFLWVKDATQFVKHRSSKYLPTTKYNV